MSEIKRISYKYSLKLHYIYNNIVIAFLPLIFANSINAISPAPSLMHRMAPMSP